MMLIDKEKKKKEKKKQLSNRHFRCLMFRMETKQIWLTRFYILPLSGGQFME
jgi:hypothetical protein